MSAGEVFIVFAIVAYLIWRVRRSNQPRGPAR